MQEDIESKLMENLVPILGLDSVEDIHPDSALVRDLGADSIDYVEILYMIENEFGVKVSIDSVIRIDDGNIDEQTGLKRLSATQADQLNKEFETGQFLEGQTTSDIFKILTVRNLATLIGKKLS